MNSVVKSSAQPDDLFGLKVLVEGEDPVVDIIAVHGLDGGKYSTFQHKNGTMWLKDLLPQYIPNARICTYGYDAYTHSTHQINCQYIYEHATTFVAKLILARKHTKTEKRPIIFVAHSLGGILVKSALSYSDLARPGIREDQKALSLATYGVLFFGTPHLGGELTEAGQILLNIASIFVHTNTKLLKDLSMFSQFLQQQLSEYSFISNRYETVFLYETLKDPRVGKIIVPMMSACVPGATNAQAIGLEKDHVNLVKFADATDDDFDTVKTVLELMVEAAPAPICQRWVKWEREKNQENINFRLNTLRLGFIQNKQFVGRDDIIFYIQKSLTSNIKTKQRVFAICGMGGVGKSQIALEYAYRYQQFYSAIHWIDATSEETVAERFWQMAQRYLQQLIKELGVEEASRLLPLPETLNLEEKEKSAKNLKKTVSAMMEWLGRPDNSEWLLIFDGYDDIESFSISEYLPQTTHGRIIITSRRDDCKALALDSVTIGELSTQDGIKLLLQGTSIDLEKEKEIANSIVFELGGLPLALAQANTYIRQRGMDLEEYLERYRHRFKSVMETMDRVSWTYHGTVLTTWEISFAHISEERPRAAKLLLIFSYFSHLDIPELLIRKGVETKDDSLSLSGEGVEADLELLVSYALIRKTTSHVGTYFIHPVVYKWARERQDSASAEAVAESALSLFARALSYDDDSRDIAQWSWERKLKQQIYAFMENTQIFWRGWFSSTQNLDRFHWIPAVLGEQGDVKKAINLQREIVSAHLTTFGEKDPKTMEVINRLGVFLYEEGIYKEAEEKLLQAFHLRESIFGSNHRKTLQSWGDAVIAGMELGDDKQLEAERLLRSLLERRIELFGETDRDTLESYHNFGSLLLRIGKESEAEPLLRKATEGRQKAMGSEHPYTLLSQDALRTALNRLGKLPDSLQASSRTIEIARRVLGQEHPYCIIMMQDLADVCADQRHFDEAITRYQEILKIQEKSLGKDDPRTRYTMQTIGCLLNDAHRYAESRKINKELLEILQRVSDANDRDTIVTMNNLGTSLEGLHETEMAEKLLHDTLELTKDPASAVSPDDDLILAVMNNLANTMRLKGSYEKGAELNRQVLAKLKETKGSKDAWTLKSLSNSGQTLLLQGKVREAIPLLVLSIEGQEVVFGEDNPDTVKVKHMLVLAEDLLIRLEHENAKEIRRAREHFTLRPRDIARFVPPCMVKKKEVKVVNN